jgi:hypothetical protein
MTSSDAYASKGKRLNTAHKFNNTFGHSRKGKNATIRREKVLRWWLEPFAEFRLLETSGVVFTVRRASSMLCRHG